MSISEEELRKIAELARLDFTPEEWQRLHDSLSGMMTYMAKLGELDLRDVEPMMRVDDTPRPLRDDVPAASLPSEAVFRNAPAVNLGHFSIPKTVSQE